MWRRGAEGKCALSCTRKAPPDSDLCAFVCSTCRGDRKKGITAAWKPRGADSTQRPSAGCWSRRSRVCADPRFRGATSSHPRPLRPPLLLPRLSGPPPPSRPRPCPQTLCTPPGSSRTTRGRRRRRTAVWQVRISALARGSPTGTFFFPPPLSHSSPPARHARPPTAPSSPTHSSHPRPVPTVLLPKQASPRPLQKNQASTSPATQKVEVKCGIANQALFYLPDWNRDPAPCCSVGPLNQHSLWNLISPDHCLSVVISPYLQLSCLC